MYYFCWFLIVAGLSIYLLINKRQKYWTERNVPFLRENFFFGSALSFLCNKSMTDFHRDLYRKIGPDGILGILMFQKPTLYVADLSLIQRILTKDFHFFEDRGLKFNTEQEPLTNHLFHLEGKEWKCLKVKLTSLFAANSVKQMLPPMLNCSTQLNLLLNRYSDFSDIEMKQILGRFTIDAIGNCAFGIYSNSLFQPDSEFHKMSKRIFAPRIRMILKLVLPNLPNTLVKLFDIRFVEQSVSRYFISIIDAEIKQREIGGVEKNDFLSSLLKLKTEISRNKTDSKNSPENDFRLTTEVITAQCFLFFAAAYENISSILCFALYELCKNSDVQNKLFQEISTLSSTPSFEEISNMKYMDMVFSEVLRLHPPASAVVRVCTKDYKIPNLNCVIERGTQVVIPTTGLQRDERYFKNADTFNPDNFSAENKSNRQPFAYIPFGDGPRSCIGRKFGVTLIKLVLAMLLREFIFFPSTKMKIPIELEERTFTASMKGGIWVCCIKRHRHSPRAS